MKFLLLVLFGCSVFTVNYAFASCAGPSGGLFYWQDVPCHDTGESIEQQKRDWALFYHFKGSDWMEKKTVELESLIKNGFSEEQIKNEWIGNGETYIPQNYYFWQYYNLFTGNPPPDQNKLVFDALPETRQTDCDEQCKKDRERGLFGAWKCEEDTDYPGNYLCYLGPSDIEIAIPQNAESSKSWLKPITVSKWVNSTIKWINFDNKQHTIVSIDGLFQPKQISPKSAFSFTFEDEGNFEYYLEANPQLLGNIAVTSHDSSYREGEPIRRGTNNSHKTQMIFREGLDQWKTIGKIAIIDENQISLNFIDSLTKSFLSIGDKTIIECLPKHDLYSEQSSLVLRDIDHENGLVHFILQTEMFPNTNCEKNMGSPQNLELKPFEIPESTNLNISCDKECKERLESHSSKFLCHQASIFGQNYMCAEESPMSTSLLLTSTDSTGEQLVFRPTEALVSIGLNNTIRWHNSGYPTTISNQEGIYDSLSFPFNDIQYQVLDKPGQYIFFDESNPSVKVNVDVVPLDQNYDLGNPFTRDTIFPDVRFQTFRVESDSQNFINKISISDLNTVLVTVDNQMDEQYWISENPEKTSIVKMSVGDKAVSGCTFHYDTYSRIFYHELQEINNENDTVLFQETLGFEPGNKCTNFYDDPISVGVTHKENIISYVSPLKQFNFGIPINEIQCKGSLVLIQKYDDSPACVKPETKHKLIERGWSEPKKQTIFSKQQEDQKLDPAIQKAKELGISNIMNAVDSKDLSYGEKLEYIKIRYEENGPVTQPSLNLRIQNLAPELEYGEQITFTLIENGYANPCTSPKLEIYLIEGHRGLYSFEEKKPIYERQLVYSCPKFEEFFPILNYWSEKDFSDFPSCIHEGVHVIVGDSGTERHSLAEYYCNSP